MTFDAGSIEAQMTLDRAPFQAGLDAAKAEANKFTDNKITAKADIDIKDAIAKLALLRAEMAKNSEVKINTSSSQTAITQLTNRTKQLSSAADDANKHFNPLLTAIITVGPALVPLSGAVLGLSSAFVGLGAAGILAVKGITANMKEGTELGKQYTAQINTLKNALTTLENSAAKGVFSGFASGVAKINNEMPQLNLFIQKMSSILGDVASHAIGAIVDGFNTFEPLIEKAADEIDRLAAGFEKWAQGPGGSTFMHAISADTDSALPALGSLIVLASKIVEAFAPVGSQVLGIISGLSDQINRIPLPILQGLVTTFVALKIATTVAQGINLATAAVLKLAGAQGVLAASATVAAGSEDVLSTSLARVQAQGLIIAGRNDVGVAGAAAAAARGPIGGATEGALGGAGLGEGAGAGFLATQLPLVGATIAPIIGFGLAITAAGKATQGWSNSTNGALRGISNGFNGLSNLITGHFANAWDDLLDKQAKSIFQTKLQSDLISQIQHNVNTPGYTATSAGTKAFSTTAGVIPNNEIGGLPKNAFLISQAPTPGDYIDVGRAQAYAAAMSKVNQQEAIFNKALASTPVSQAGAAFTNLATGLEANVDAQGKFLTTGGQTVKTIDGLKISTTAWDAALKASHGNAEVALGDIEGQISSMHTQQAAINQAINATNTLNKFQSDVEAKYKLTSAQVDLFASALGLSNAQIAKGGAYYNQAEASIGALAKTFSNASTTVTDLVTAFANFDAGADTAATRGQLLGAILQAANGPLLSYANTMNSAAVANQQLVDGFTKTSRATINAKTGFIDFKNAAAAPLLQGLQALQTGAVNAAAATYQYETSLGKASAASDAFRVYTADTKGALESQYKQMGISQPLAKKLADTYFDIKNSGDLKKQITLLGNDQVTPLLKSILNDLDIIAKKNPKPKVSLTWDGAAAAEVDGKLAKYATRVQVPVGPIYSPQPKPKKGAVGMFVNQGSTPTADDVHIMVSKGEAVIAADMVQQHYDIVSALVNKQPIYSAANGIDPAGFDGVTKPKATKKTASSSSATSASSALVAKEKSLAGTLSGLYSSAVSALGYSVNPITSALNAIVSAFRSAGEDMGHVTPSVKTMSKQIKNLEADAKAYTTAANKLVNQQALVANDKSNIASIKAAAISTVTGGFDIGSSGNGYGKGIAESQSQTITADTKFNALLAQAAKEGYSADYLSQLAQEGPAAAGANLQALVTAGASKAYVTSINNGQAALSKQAGITAGYATTSAQIQLTKDTAEQTTLAKAAAKAREKESSQLTEIKNELTKLRTELAAAERRKGK